MSLLGDTKQRNVLLPRGSGIWRGCSDAVSSLLPSLCSTRNKTVRCFASFTVEDEMHWALRNTTAVMHIVSRGGGLENRELITFHFLSQQVVSLINAF